MELYTFTQVLYRIIGPLSNTLLIHQDFQGIIGIKSTEYIE